MENQSKILSEMTCPLCEQKETQRRPLSDPCQWCLGKSLMIGIEEEKSLIDFHNELNSELEREESNT